KLALALEVPPALLLPQPDDIVRSVCATAATQAAHEKIQVAELSEVVSTESLPTESVPAGRSQALAVRAPKHRAPNLSAQKLYPNGEANGLSLEDLAPFSPEYTAYKRRPRRQRGIRFLLKLRNLNALQPLGGRERKWGSSLKFFLKAQLGI